MTDKRVYNFSAGPSQLPVEVLKEAADQMLNYKGSGMSVMEMSHRSSTYQKIFDDTKADSIITRRGNTGIHKHCLKSYGEW